jgi:phasin family protein
MYVTPDKFAATNKAGVEALLGFAQAQIGAIERLAQLNIESTKEALSDSAEHVKSLLEAKDPQELMKLNAAYAQPALAKAVTYSKSVYDVTSQTQATVTRLIEAHAADMNKAIVTFLDNMSKNAPVGADAAVSAVKTALAAANTAYDSISRVAKQAAEVVEVNFTNAANAAKTSKVKKPATA